MTETEGLLLHQLCGICHNKTPKYRCPRCSIRTCSLPCIRRHKKWSQCSGERNPGTYLKRGDLCTPQAIDRDFNFITDIERRLERAEEDSETRGIKIQKGDGAGNGSQQGPKGEVALLRAAERSEVRLIKAPKGLSRNKLNRSRWLQRSKQIAWSIEWRTSNTIKIQHDCLETLSLSDIYSNFLRSKKPKFKKRKYRNSDSDLEHENSQEQPAVSDDLSQMQAYKNITSDENAKAGGLLSNTLNTLSTIHSAEKEKDPFENSALRSLYLHRPNTPSGKSTVLIPVLASDTLSSALRGRDVLEFPTIYVFESTRLPHGFIVEDEYLANQKGEPSTDWTKWVDQEKSASGHIDLGAIDKEKFLEVLRRDIGE